MCNKRKVLSFIGRHTFTFVATISRHFSSLFHFCSAATCVSAKRRKAYYRRVAERETKAFAGQHLGPTNKPRRDRNMLPSHRATTIAIVYHSITWVAIHNCNNNKPCTKWRWSPCASPPKNLAWNKRKWHQIKSHRYKCEECILVATQLLLLLFGKVKRHHIYRLVAGRKVAHGCMRMKDVCLCK